MALRPFITEAEEQKIIAKLEAGWTKARICKKFHRTHVTVMALEKRAASEKRKTKRNAKDKANRAKIAAANKALENQGTAPANDLVASVVTKFCGTLREQHPDLKTLVIDLETDECQADFTTKRRFKIGA